MKRWILLTMAALALSACPNQVEPPVDEPDAGRASIDASAPMDAGRLPMDAGTPQTAILLDRANLAPATQIAETEQLRLRARLRPTSPGQGETSRHKIRGGVVPLTR